MGRKVFLEIKNEDIIKEVSDLINFLEEYSQRRVGDITIPHDFKGEYSRCSIRIIASRERRSVENVGSQAAYILDAVRNGYENIYIIGSGEKDNEKFMSLVEKEVLKQNKKLQPSTRLSFLALLNFYNGFKKVKSCLIHFHNPEVVDYIVYKAKTSS